MSRKENVLVGLHIPKCAGSTLLERVSACLPKSAIYQTTSAIQNYRDGTPEFLQLQNHDRLRFIFGHSTHEEMIKILGKRCVLFTGLREPAERLISLANYRVRLRKQQGHSEVPIGEIVQQLAPDQMCWTIINRFPALAGTAGSPADRAFRALQNFHIVYFTDNFEAIANALFRILGIDPLAVNANEAPEKAINLPINRQLIRYDIELYKRAREAFAPIRPSDSLRLPKPGLAELLSSPVDLPKLRAFLYRHTYSEYDSWVGIDAIVASRVKLIAEISAEVSIYMAMKSEERPPAGIDSSMPTNLKPPPLAASLEPSSEMKKTKAVG